MAFEKESQRFQENLLKPLSKADRRDVNPFRGLEFFDFKHARFFCGRRKRVAEALDVLEQKAAANKPFVLVLGPAGCGKTSLVRAGILPLLTQAGKVEENEPWRHAVTRPATEGRDPFDALAAALLTKSGLPEFPGAAAVNAWENLAVDLREYPERAALLLRGTLDRLGVEASKSPADHQGFESASAGGKEGVEYKLGRVKPRMRCALVVDQLEELFAGGIPPEQKQKYLATLGALVRSQGFFVIATLRSDFYDSFLRTCGPDNLAVLSGRFELSPPTAHEIGEMIRLPSEAIGLRFEKDPKSGRNLDEAISEAASVNAEPLPLVEHLLSQLYQKQMPRGDGLLRWSDYRELGELKGALAHHAESTFLALDEEAQDALGSVTRQLVSPVHGQQGACIRRTVSYRDLVSAPELYDQKAGAKELIDRFIKEGLFQAEVGLNAERHVTVTQEALLRSWPRVRQLLSDDVGLLRMRDRLEADLKLWVSRGRKRGDLLRSVLGLGEAETLVRGFRASLTDAQLDYAQRSLKAQRRRRRFRRSLMLAAMVGLASLVIVPVVKLLLEERQTAEMLAARQRNALQAQLKETEAKVQQAQQNAELAASQRDALQRRLKETEAGAQQTQKNAQQVASQRDALQAQLKETEARIQQAQQNAELATSQRGALQTRLKETEASAQQAQKNAQQVAGQRDALQAQLKETEAGSRQLQKNLEVATSQREGLQGQLKDSAAKLQQAQNNGELVASERDRLQAQLAGLSAAQQAEKSKGLGSAEATAATGVNADAGSTAPTSKNEPMPQDQEPVKLARMNQSQPTASTPIPPVAASVEPTPEAQADGSSEASAEERSLEEFIRAYIKTVASDDISAQKRFFAQRVNFYGQGVLSLPGVQASMERYHREWPIRKWKASGEPAFPKTLHSTNPHLYEVLQPLTWSVSNVSEHKRGNATLYVRISKNDQGEFHIVHVEQRNP